MIAATIGERTNTLEIQAIASFPSVNHIFTVTKYDELPSIIGSVVGATCDEVNECSSNPCRNGGQCLNQNGRYLCECRGSFTGKNCERRCTTSKDVVFIMDVSGSLKERLQWQQTLARRIATGLNYDNARVKVGAIAYDNDLIQNQIFPLNSFNKLEEVLNALVFVQRSGRKGTNTAKALEFLYKSFFGLSQFGDRQGVENIGIVISDGRSNLGKQSTIQQALIAKSRNIRLITIGVGDNIDPNELQSIASQPTSGNYFTMRDLNDDSVDDVTNKVLQQLCAN